jgi:DNA repair protein RecO (recombination protein O)
MAIAKASGFIIRETDYQESGRIVALLSSQIGKISLLAKGARRLESRFGAALDLLNLIEVVFYEGRGLKLLKEAAIIKSYAGLKRDYERLEAALQAARSLNILLKEGQRDKRIYHLFAELLEEMERDEGSPALLLLGFKLKLIDLLGFGPELDRCSLCRRPLEEAEPFFSAEAGGVVCSSCRREGDPPIDKRLVKGMKMILRLPLRKLNRLILPEELITQGKEILDRFISYHLQPI